jgi:ribonucleoside-diphosphate reductase alpha chain
MTRVRLPNRKPPITESIRWQGRRIHCRAGFDPATGTIKELFFRGGSKVGSEREHLLDDLAVLISRLLQHGEGIEEIRRGLGRLPGGAPASIAGAALDWLADLDREVAKGDGPKAGGSA